LNKFESVTWYGILTKAGTPAPIVQKTYTDIMAVVRAPDVNKTLISQGVEILGMNPAQFATYLKSEISKWAAVVKQAGDLQAQ
jgi:tripartite-type tricarboxylate transporter receptor subunit TctC